MKFFDKQQLAIIAAAFAIIVVFSAVVYVPLAKQNMQLKEQKMTFYEKNGEIKSQVELIPSTFRERNELRAQIGDYDVKIPTERNFAQVWEKLSQAMDAQGLSDQLIQPAAEIQGEDDIVCIPLNIECTGRLSGIFGFFQSLEELDRLIRVEKLGISKNDEDTGELKMSAKAKIFYRKAKTM